MASQDLQETVGESLVPYVRGIPMKDIATGALGRFLPGALTTMVGAALILEFSVSGPVLGVVGGFLGIAATLTAGFGLGLFGLRRWLYPDANVSGRRSFIAGLMAPFALFIGATGAQSWNVLLLPVLLILVGMILALGMYFAWLTETPEEMRGETREGDPSRLVGLGETRIS